MREKEAERESERERASERESEWETEVTRKNEKATYWEIWKEKNWVGKGYGQIISLLMETKCTRHFLFIFHISRLNMISWSYSKLSKGKYGQYVLICKYRMTMIFFSFEMGEIHHRPDHCRPLLSLSSGFYHYYPTVMILYYIMGCIILCDNWRFASSLIRLIIITTIR